MEKNLDQWNEIADLIHKEKKRALDDFSRTEFVPGDLPVRRMALRTNWRLALRPVSMAAAASVLLAFGLVSFWLLRSSWQKVPAVPVLDNLLADSFLYGSGSRSREIAPQPCADSSFTLALTAWSNSGWNRTAAPAAEPIDPTAPVEHGDPGTVRLKIEKVIRENSIKQMLTQFCQICKEV